MHRHLEPKVIIPETGQGGLTFPFAASHLFNRNPHVIPALRDQQFKQPQSYRIPDLQQLIGSLVRLFNSPIFHEQAGAIPHQEFLMPVVPVTGSIQSHDGTQYEEIWSRQPEFKD